MQLRVIRTRTFAVAAILLLAGVIGSTGIEANCPNGVVLTWSGGNYFSGCGLNAEAFFWANHMAVQRKHNANTALSTTAGGNDLGNVPGANALLPVAGEDGSYMVNTDWGLVGADGCALNADLNEADPANCITSAPGSSPPTNFMITGVDPLNPAKKLSAVISVDFLEAYSTHELAQAGAPVVDGNPCFGADVDSWRTTNVVCGEIPIPKFANLGTCTAAGCTHTFTTPASTIPIADDCDLAFSKTLNCPRNLDGGFQLMAKRGDCAIVPADHHVYTGLTPGGLVAQTAVNNWFPFASQDLNLNGVQDGGEVAFTPVIFQSAGEAGKEVFVPAVAGQTDCLYLAMALRVDPNAVLAFGVQHEPVLSTLVTVNTNPIHVDAATPASDRVLNLVASKTGGKSSVSWDTTAELTTAGFNLIGTKKNGGTVQLNSSLIPAKQGTTGQGASYSASFGGSDLKGSTAVYVELVKTNGAKERFGPASF